MKPVDEPRALWRYTLEDGWSVAVGRSDHANEQLSLEWADRNDYWLHVKGLPGSHVVLHNEQEPGSSAPGAVLRHAASIAAWHSKARNAGRVPVHVTRAAHVSKPRGAKRGTVSIRNETTIKTRPAQPLVDNTGKSPL